LLHLRAATTPHLRIDHTTTSSFGAVQFYEDTTQQAAIGALGSTSSGTGGGNALQIWNFLNAPTVFATNNTERGRWDSDGRFLVGTSSSSNSNLFAVRGNTGGSTGQGIMSLQRGSANPSSTSSLLGVLRFTDSNESVGAEIQAAVDSAWATDDYATRLVFSTTADGASSPSKRVQVDSGSNTIFYGTGEVETARFTGARNILIGGTLNPTSATNSIGIVNGTAPTASITDGIVLYAQDVSASSELRVRDEAGNVTTLSPHNFALIPEGPSEDMAWSYYSERDGKQINVDMLKAIRLLEQLSGEKLVYSS
jgi:hypothetical protein